MLPASAFADELEARLLARAGYEQVETMQNHDAVEDAPTLPSIVALDPPGNPSGHHPRRTARGSPRVSWKAWTSLAAVILLALTITTFTVAANASPGNALYGVRRWQEDARTNLTNSDADRAKLHLQYATDALDALDAAVAQHADANVYNEALARFSDEMSQAAAALAQVPSGNDHDTLSASLDDLRARGRNDLRAALPSLSWSGRITTTSALGTLGETVLTVKQASGVRSGSFGARMWTLTIMGSGFQGGAVLLVRQRPAGHVLSLTATRLVAQLPAGADDSLPHDIGVGNPDDTAAVTGQVASEHDDSGLRPTGTPGGCGGEHEDHSASCTPTSTSTPTFAPTSTPDH
jgi:hypothetical protein